jgi:hypothetical protein
MTAEEITRGCTDVKYVLNYLNMPYYEGPSALHYIVSNHNRDTGRFVYFGSWWDDLPLSIIKDLYETLCIALNPISST